MSTERARVEAEAARALIDDLDRSRKGGDVASNDPAVTAQLAQARATLAVAEYLAAVTDQYMGELS